MKGVFPWAWSVKGLDPTTRIVLLALASRADNDTLDCFPSTRKLAEDCEVSESSVKRHLKVLADRKLITIIERKRDNGTSASNLYRLQVDIEFRHPDGGRVQIEPLPVQNEPVPVQVEPVPVHGRTPTNYPTELIPQKATPSSGRARKPAPVFVVPSDIPEAEWDAFDEMRRAMNAKAWTDAAKKKTVDDLRALAEAGYPPGEVLMQSVQRGWRGVFKLGDIANDRTPRSSNQGPGSHRRTAADLLNDLRGVARMGG